MGKTQYKKSSQTQDRILDVAEDLFAKQGFDATTTRQITAAAGVRNASVNYYFETKRDLMVAVIDRRFDSLRLEREEMLDRVNDVSSDAPAKIKAIVEAFVLPLAKLTQDDPIGWGNYNRIMAQLAIRSEWPQDDYSTKVNEIAKKFMARFQEVNPQSSPADVITAYQFMLGAVLFTFTTNDRFQQAGRTVVDPAQIVIDPQPLVAFLAAGLGKLMDVSQ